MGKKFLALLMSTSMLISVFAGCGNNSAPQATEQTEQTEQTATEAPETAVEEVLDDGVYEATAVGFGGDVTATLSVENGVVASFVITGADETAGIGATAIDTMNETLAALGNKGEDALKSIDLDTITGATVTSVAAKNAVSAAVSKATGEETSAKAPVADASVVVEVPANSVAQKMQVEVSLKNNSIESIAVKENGETESILKTVTDLLIPRIIETQSLSVDSITGATVSSNALKSAVALAIDENGGSSSEWYTPIEKKTDTVKLDGYDVIVVGLGGSGMTSYVSAAENGAIVFGLDSAGKVGGTSTNVSGPMAINPKTKMDAENNGEKWLEEEDLIADWLQYTQGDAKEDLVRLFVNESGETMDWMITDYQFGFDNMRAFFHPNQWVVWASYTGDKTEQYVAAIEKAKAANEKNDYMLELTATELIMDGGEIKGVVAIYYDGTTYEIYGDSVILATGGFIGNAEMQEEYFNTTYSVEGMLQDDGAGIKMALSAGGATYNIDMPAMVHIAQTKTILRTDELTADQKAVLTAMVLKPDSMVVGEAGTRYMSEAGNIAFDNWKGGGSYYAIYSQEQIENYKTAGMEHVAAPMFLNQGGTLEANTPIADMDEILRIGEEVGMVIRADTAEELAAKLDAAGLVDEMARYTAYDAGTESDPFGKDTALMHSLENGPFVAVIGAGYYYGTCGGLDIDTNMNVLKTDGTAIENLYAVGQDSMGVLFTNKDAYVTYGGAAQGWVLTSGRLAGRHAAEKFAS